MVACTNFCIKVKRVGFRSKLQRSIIPQASLPRFPNKPQNNVMPLVHCAYYNKLLSLFADSVSDKDNVIMNYWVRSANRFVEKNVTLQMNGKVWAIAEKKLTPKDLVFWNLIGDFKLGFFFFCSERRDFFFLKRKKISS